MVRLDLFSMIALAVMPLVCAELPEEAVAHAVFRGNYENCRIRFEQDKVGHVAFLGGSITENSSGHSAMIPAWLQQRFPETRFTFTNAGIASTCSTTGAFRLEDHVLKQGPVDLLVVEFAVNDELDAGHSSKEATRGLEGIIRHARDYNPNVDVLQIHFTDASMLKKFEQGKTPVSVAAHEAVAKHYGLASVNVGAALAAGAQDWATYGGTHPKTAGYRLVSDMVISLLEEAWKKPLTADAEMKAPVQPEALDEGSYSRGRFLLPENAIRSGIWSVGKGTRELLPEGGIRERFKESDLTVGTGVGTEISFRFRGRSVGAFVLAGPDAALLETSIDDGPFREIDLYHRHSRGLNYPRTLLFADDLVSEEHKLTLRIVDREKRESGGDRAAILEFVVND